MQRRKVQAQRKFAQGVHIPTSVNTSTPKSNYKTPNDENSNVFISTTATTVTHLLDILSLKDSHEHLPPFVLLERLPDSTKLAQKKIKPSGHGSIPKVNSEMKNYKRTNNKLKNELLRISLLTTSEDETPLLYLKNHNIKKKEKKGAPLKLSETIHQQNEEPVSKEDTAITNPSINQLAPNDTVTESNAIVIESCTTAEIEMPHATVTQPQPSTSFDNIETQDNLRRTNSSEINFMFPNYTDNVVEDNNSNNTKEETKIFDSTNVCKENDYEANEFCPSEVFLTMDQVIHAKANEFAKQCLSCIHCTNVNNVRRILKHYRVLVCNFRNSVANKTEFSNQNRDLHIFIPAMKQSVMESVLTYYLNLTPKINSVIKLELFWDYNNRLEVISADMIPKKPEIEVTNLHMAPNHKLFKELLDFISKSEIRYCKIDSDEICNEKSKPGFRSSVTIQDSVNSHNPSIQIHKQNPVSFPMSHEQARQVDAPQFFPTEEEFMDPIKYFIDIMPIAAKFGICKVVAPEGFKPQCILDDSVRFAVTNQYISRLFRRWGSGIKELCAIKAYLASQSVIFNRPPLLDGIEVNLPKLYRLVQRYGGLPKVIEKKRWSKIAEDMRLRKTQKIGNKLDKIYVKYILPYDTLSQEERKELMQTMELHWEKKYQRMLKRALKPLHRQKRLLGESETSEEEVEEDVHMSGALNEAEDCITKGRIMKLSTYQKVAYRAAETYLLNTKNKTVDAIEKDYWRIVTEAKEHVCVNSASIDTGDEGYGFTKNQSDYYGTHPWNLKVLSQNSGNVLKSLGPVLGVTVPTLHLGMTFSTSCWHRDPHGLPWIEYMHSGPGKVWYGIPDEQSDNFRRAVEELCPTSCQKKSIWLPSDIVMIPPDQLLEHQVSISRVVQKPGEFIIVFPKAYSCSVSTGYTESESVYFAPYHWLDTIDHIFMELRESCEPTMFSIEQLLLSIARDPQASPNILSRLDLSLENIIRKELANRLTLSQYKVQEKSQQKRVKTSRKRPAGAWNVREQEECGICQATLYLSRVWGLTDKKQSVCLQHALELLNSKQWRTRDVANVGLEVFLTESELERVITNIHKRLRNEC